MFGALNGVVLPPQNHRNALLEGREKYITSTNAQTSVEGPFAAKHQESKDMAIGKETFFFMLSINN